MDVDGRALAVGDRASVLGGTDPAVSRSSTMAADLSAAVLAPAQGVARPVAIVGDKDVGVVVDARIVAACDVVAGAPAAITGCGSVVVNVDNTIVGSRQSAVTRLLTNALDDLAVVSDEGSVVAVSR